MYLINNVDVENERMLKDVENFGVGESQSSNRLQRSNFLKLLKISNQMNHSLPSGSRRRPGEHAYPSSSSRKRKMAPLVQKPENKANYSKAVLEQYKRIDEIRDPSEDHLAPLSQGKFGIYKIHSHFEKKDFAVILEKRASELRSDFDKKIEELSRLKEGSSIDEDIEEIQKKMIEKFRNSRQEMKLKINLRLKEVLSTIHKYEPCTIPKHAILNHINRPFNDYFLKRKPNESRKSLMTGSFSRTTIQTKPEEEPDEPEKSTGSSQIKSEVDEATDPNFKLKVLKSDSDDEKDKNRGKFRYRRIGRRSGYDEVPVVRRAKRSNQSPGIGRPIAFKKPRRNSGAIPMDLMHLRLATNQSRFNNSKSTDRLNIANLMMKTEERENSINSILKWEKNNKNPGNSAHKNHHNHADSGPRKGDFQSVRPGVVLKRTINGKSELV